MRKNLKPFLKILLVLMLPLLLVLALYVAPRQIKINSIICESQYGPCPQDLELLQQFNSRSLYDAKEEINKYLSAEEAIDKYDIHFLLPDRLKISVLQEKAAYGIVGPHGQIAMVNESGKVLSYRQQSLLPTLYIQDTPPSVGTIVDTEKMFALKILSYMGGLYSTYEGDLKEDGLEVNLKDGPTIIFPLEGDEKEVVGSVILIINELNKARYKTRMEQGDLSKCGDSCVIDLRYKNPVVKL